MKRKLTVILIVLALAAAIALTVIHLLGQRTEYNLEMADLQGMRVAEASAHLLWKDKLPEEPTEYWFDAGSFTLVPGTEPMTMVYGAGTEKAGGAMKDFEAETGKHYEYSETQSYNGMLIHVTVKDNEGTLQVDVDWVPVN